MSFRLPESQDLAAIARGGRDDPARELLERCIVSAEHRGTACAARELPPSIVAAIEDEMARADPYADTRLALECPACGHAWTLAFDIASFMWRELEARALAIVRDVHALASAYGWSERDIVQMSTAKRAVYLELAGA